MFFFLTLPNEIQYTIRQMNSTERKCTRQSVRIERIVKPSAPLTIIKVSFFFQVSPMGCNIPSVNCTLRSEKALNDPYKSNGSISLLYPSPSTKMISFLSLPKEIHIPSVNCTLRTVNSPNDPHGSNGSLSLLHPSPHQNIISFPSPLMRCNIPSVNCTLRTVNSPNSPNDHSPTVLYGSQGHLTIRTDGTN